MSITRVTTAEVIRARENWLWELRNAIAPWYEKQGYPLPSARIGVGFPSTGRKSKRVGECWGAEHSSDKHHEIFIHPMLSDPLEVSECVSHELTHAAVGNKAKHGPLFKKVAVGIGLEGPMRSTRPGPLFIKNITPILESLGVYPHGKLDTLHGNSSRGPSQKGRMVKAFCPECNYIIRASKACLEIGVPPCPNPDCDLSFHKADDLEEVKTMEVEWPVEEDNSDDEEKDE